ncbi:hypothetical protein LCGC14_0405500 [marine sediment metagenome]|uniref:YopX protein domain-containing protein n=1 Tax=marine sediment metagenome TaxID=412755 RepID=A0A0F9VHJ7_9ZZZZ|nr:hypothetical protein [archaeon]
MNKLKFRAHIKHLDLTWYVDRINFDTQEVVFIYQTYFTQGGEYIFKFGEVEIMQFIGLKDKDDIEIYEGDIIRTQIKIDGNDTFEIKYEESVGMFIGKPHKRDGEAFMFSMMKAGLPRPKNIQIEIIGDIYSQD